mgnify:CR=1 FL=1
MCKNDLLKWAYELPDDIQIFRTAKDSYDCVNIKIFIQPKDQEFLEWYFGI